jgi:hypothetical protein
VANTGENVRLILLNALPATAPVTKLSAVQFALNEFQINRHAERQPGDPRDQSLPVRFTRADESKHATRILPATPGKRAILPDAFTRVKRCAYDSQLSG